MFDGVAKRYDLTNTVLSGGMDHVWRRRARSLLAPRPGERILDLAAGTAVSTVELAKSGAHHLILRNTSVGVQEMFLVTQSISSATFKTFEIFIVAALYYLLLTSVWTVIQWFIERHYNHLVGLPYEIPLA